MKFDVHDLKRNQMMLTGRFAKKGYDWWWHSFTARDAVTGEEKPFFVEFYLINPKLDRGEPVLGQSEVNRKKGLRPSYLMVNCGTWGKDARQLHRFFSFSKVKMRAKAPFSIEADDCFLSDTELRGSVSVSSEEAEKHPELMSGAGTMSFNLKVHKDIAFNVGYGTSKLFRDLKAFEMYWHAEGMKSEYEGTVELDGRKYLVSKENSFGYADKNWGNGFTTPWVWLSSNDIVSLKTGERLDHSVFDIGGGKPKAFGISLPNKLLGAFYLEGKEYEYNFSKFWKGVKTRFYFKEDETKVYWHIEQENHQTKMVTDISCRKEDMLFIRYEDPLGHIRHHHLYNGGNGEGTVKLYAKKGNALLGEYKVGHVGCEYGVFD
jgi:tocopherol cyclase